VRIRTSIPACVLLVVVWELLFGAPARVAGAQEVIGATAGPAPVPEVDARSWVLSDAETGEVLGGENTFERLPMGSTDKMVVTLVALDAVASGETSFEEEVTVSKKAASYARPIYSNVGLRVGDSLSVKELVAATLIASGNDASYALAEHLGGGGRVGVERFVAEMNRKVEALGLEDTRFENPTGLDARGQYSSARDLAAIARAGLEDPVFRGLVATDYTTITTQDRAVEVATTNELLGAYGPATGVKTGYTPGAGPCLVASAVAEDEAYVSVVMGDEDRFPDSMRLLDYGFASYDRREVIVEGERYARADVPYRRSEKIDLVASEVVELLVDGAANVELKTEVSGELPDSAVPGTRLGRVVVVVDGKKSGESPLVAKQGYGEASLVDRAWFTVEGIWAG